MVHDTAVAVVFLRDQNDFIFREIGACPLHLRPFLTKTARDAISYASKRIPYEALFEYAEQVLRLMILRRPENNRATW